MAYEPIVVNTNSEFELELSEGKIVDMKEAIAEAVDEKTVNSSRDSLYNIRRRLEDIIYNTNLSIDKNTNPEKLAKINNIILELEKASINLGATITESNTDAGINISPEEIEELKRSREQRKQKSAN